jgi:hypothetical protein
MIDNGTDLITDNITLSSGFGPIPPSYTISSNPSINWSNITVGNGGTTSNTMWATTPNTIGKITPSANISLKGENADIDLNGKSLKNWMEKVEERLNILTPNPELEKEWDELRELGERYRELEKQCKEKAEVWKKLKSIPLPQV